jgi:hypothetical protein
MHVLNYATLNLNLRGRKDLIKGFIICTLHHILSDHLKHETDVCIRQYAKKTVGKPDGRRLLVRPRGVDEKVLVLQLIFEIQVKVCIGFIWH